MIFADTTRSDTIQSSFLVVTGPRVLMHPQLSGGRANLERASLPTNSEFNAREISQVRVLDMLCVKACLVLCCNQLIESGEFSY